jgi:hypothetical protein
MLSNLGMFLSDDPKRKPLPSITLLGVSGLVVVEKIVTAES